MKSIYYDLITREYDMNHNIFSTTKLVNNILSSKYLIEKYEMKGLLKGHLGCVNTVLFSDDGSYIFTGSDDTKVNIYHTETYKLVKTYDTIHTNNIFYARDLPSTDMSIMVTCAADGRVVLSNLHTNDAIRIYRHRGRAHRIGLVPGEGNQFYTCGEDGVCCLFDLRESNRHSNLNNQYESNGSSAVTNQETPKNNYSLDTTTNENIYSPVLKTHFLNGKDKKCSIYTVGVNPMQPYELALAGSYSHVAIYDSRKISTPHSYLCPEHLASSPAHITGLKYDHTGQMIIASYNDENIYSFYTKEHAIINKRNQSRSRTISTTDEPSSSSTMNNDKVRDTLSSSKTTYTTTNNQISTPTHENISNTGVGDMSKRSYYRSYVGHRNNNTVKQVAFLGGRSDYIVSGSDCGHIFIWDVHSPNTINNHDNDNDDLLQSQLQPIQMLHADKAGAINCLAAHPSLPILATSGLEADAKVWVPTGEYDPILDGTPKKKKVDTIIEHNQQRNSTAFANSSLYSNSIMDMLMMLLHQQGGNVPLHSLSSDEEEADDDEEEENENMEDIAPTRSGTRRSNRRLAWTSRQYLSRLIPVVLGRRPRSTSMREDEEDGDDEEEENDDEDSFDEYDAQEMDAIDDDNDDGDDSNDDDDDDDDDGSINDNDINDEDDSINDDDDDDDDDDNKNNNVASNDDDDKDHDHNLEIYDNRTCETSV